jgi:hypothetical protein
MTSFKLIFEQPLPFLPENLPNQPENYEKAERGNYQPVSRNFNNHME